MLQSDVIKTKAIEGDKAESAPVKKSLYQKRKKFYPLMIKGKSQNYRSVFAVFFYGAFFLLPWMHWGDRPAVYFDLEARQFHIFWLNFWPQDFMFLAWTLIICAFSLFLFTTVAGRLWCGFACPQSMFTLLFMWMEELIEGKPHARKKLDESPFSWHKFRLKLAKHSVWLLIALVTSLTFVSYFYPVRDLLGDIVTLQISLAAGFWVAFFTYLTYLDAGWLREQVCIYMCPYARFQSVMYDKDTLAVGYNKTLGEPRMSVKSKVAGGQCIDCKMCVSVCPNGIDIRDGVQIDCINCGLCVDVCDDVMTSIGRPTGLISFTSMNIQEGKPLRLLRPKTIAYLSVLIIMCSLLTYNLLTRKLVEASVIRDRVNIYRELADGAVANDFILHIANKSQEEQHYRIVVKTPGFTLAEHDDIVLAQGAAREDNFSIISHEQKTGSQPLVIEVIAVANNTPQAHIETRFVFPFRSHEDAEEDKSEDAGDDNNNEH